MIHLSFIRSAPPCVRHPHRLEGDGAVASTYRGKERRQTKKRRSPFLGPTTSKTAAMAALIRRCTGWPRQTLTWASCRRPISLAGFTRRSLWDSAGFHFVASDAPIRHRGGVALFYKDPLRFTVEAHQTERPERHQIPVGDRRETLVHCGLLTCAAQCLQPGERRSGDRTQAQRYRTPRCQKFQY